MEKLYTINETAEYLRLHRRTIERWIAEGGLKTIKVRDGYRISELEIERIKNAKPPIQPPQD